MARPPIKPVEDKLRIVLAVLRGEVSIKEAARRERASETSIAAWRDQFLDGGRARWPPAPATVPVPARPSSRPRSRSSPAPLARPTWSFACGAKGGASYSASRTSR
jgi:transposase-like protein